MFIYIYKRNVLIQFGMDGYSTSKASWSIRRSTRIDSGLTSGTVRVSDHHSGHVRFAETWLKLTENTVLSELL